MLPWFSPFAAPWCGKIQRAFPKAYVTMNFELILVPRTNTYINLNHCSTPDEFKAEVIEGVSRFAFKGFTKPLCREHLDGINKLLDTDFTPEEILTMLLPRSLPKSSTCWEITPTATASETALWE